MKTWEDRERDLQYERRKAIKEYKMGCWYCIHFGHSLQYPGCHTAAWRNGKTCDLFMIDNDKQ